MSGGRSLNDFAEGSEDQVFELDFEAPKKGIGSVNLPSFYPPDQPQLWELPAWPPAQNLQAPVLGAGA